MTAVPPNLLQDYARKECICSLAIVEHAGGKDVAHLVIEAHLQAIATYLKGSIGAKGAYEVFSRYADEIISPVVGSNGGRR